MPGDEPMPKPAQLAIQLERPRREQRDERADRDGVDRGEVMALEAEDERRGGDPESAAEIQPFGAQVIEAEAEVRGEREQDAADGRVGGGDVVRRIVGQPGRNGEPQAKREACPVLPALRLGSHYAWTPASYRPFAQSCSGSSSATETSHD